MDDRYIRRLATEDEKAEALMAWDYLMEIDPDKNGEVYCFVDTHICVNGTVRGGEARVVDVVETIIEETNDWGPGGSIG